MVVEGQLAYLRVLGFLKELQCSDIISELS